MAKGVGVTVAANVDLGQAVVDPGGHRSRRAALAQLQPQVQPQRSSEGVTSGQRGGSVARMAAVRRSNCHARESISARTSSITARSLRSPRRLAMPASHHPCCHRPGRRRSNRRLLRFRRLVVIGMCRWGAKSPANIWWTRRDSLCGVRTSPAAECGDRSPRPAASESPAHRSTRPRTRPPRWVPREAPNNR